MHPCRLDDIEPRRHRRKGPHLRPSNRTCPKDLHFRRRPADGGRTGAGDAGTGDVVICGARMVSVLLCAMLCAILCAILCAMLCTGSGVGWLRDDSYAAVVRKIMSLIFRP